MTQNRLVTISKYLSKYLRHEPHNIGLQLDSQGWVKVDELLNACRKYNFPISKKELNEVVKTNDKQRFSFDDTGTRIRANQGHSIKIDLDLEPRTPPDTLYHGTVAKFLVSIQQEGLKKMSRHHVHLSSDVETARKVGQRRGKPVILTINALKMHQDGYQFFLSDNGVWLVDSVPPEYFN
jgi:putative RNA 2'-phosphotransferase